MEGKFVYYVQVRESAPSISPLIIQAKMKKETLVTLIRENASAKLNSGKMQDSIDMLEKLRGYGNLIFIYIHAKCRNQL